MNTGKHAAKAIDVALGMTETGKEQIAVLFEITQGDDAGEQITWFGYFTEPSATSKGTITRTIESLRHCGWTGNDLSTLTAEDMPNEVQIVVEEDEYKGERRLKVQWVNRLGSGIAVKTRLDASAAASFAARMKGACMAVKPAGNGQAPKPAAARGPQASIPRQAPAGVPPMQGDDAPIDDIPF